MQILSAPIRVHLRSSVDNFSCMLGAMGNDNFRPFSSRADDVWHGGTDAGGYEWWYFDALSDDGRDLLVIIFLVGFIFSPSYNRAVAAFRAGRISQAPQPTDFPALAVTLYRDGQPVYRAINEFSAADFSASRTQPDCRISNSRFYLDQQTGNYLMSLDATLRGGRRWRGEFVWELPETEMQKPARSKGVCDAETLVIDALTPCRLPQTDVLTSGFPPPAASAGFPPPTACGLLPASSAHAWNLVAPRGRVAGTWSIIAPQGQTLDSAEFSGTAYHDHNHDARWLPVTVAAWDWGRAHFPDGSTAVYYRYREHDATEAACYLLQATSNGILTPQTAQLTTHGTRQHHFGLRYARALRVTAQDGTELQITRRRVVDGSFFYLRCLDLATLTAPDGTSQSAPVVTEYLAPRALRWRWLDWLVNMRVGRNGRGAFLP